MTDVDPAVYEDSESPGFYRWVYSTSPYTRECGIFPTGTDGQEPGGLSCSVTFPAGTPAVSNPPFEGPPNTVQIILPNGPENAISEGGPPGAKTMLPNRRIAVGGFACTTLEGGGIDCSAPTGGFRFTDGVLTKRGG